MTYPEIPEAKSKFTGYVVLAVIIFLVLNLTLTGRDNVPRAAFRAKVSNTLIQVQTACLAYYTEYGSRPEAKDNAHLVKILEGDNARKIQFLALKSSDMNSNGAMIDPWGTPYQINVDSDSEIHVTSAGPDKIFGTADDITHQ
jgi:hypothetical protein